MSRYLLHAFLRAAVALSLGLLASVPTYAAPVAPKNWEVRITPNGQKKSNEWLSLAKYPDAVKLKREFQGTIEYRASFDAIKTNEPIGIYFGQIGEADRVHVNGHFVGQTGGFPPEYKNFSDVFREYLIHGDSLNDSAPNELYVEVYTQYVGLKGIKTNLVEIGDHFELQKKQYWKSLTFTIVRVGIPALCLFLAFLFLPWFSNAQDRPQNAIIPVVAVFAFLYGLGNSRVLFHLLNDFAAYKILVISALTGWVFAYLYALRSAGLKSKVILGLLVASQIAFPTAMILTTDYTMATYIAKIWIAFSLPLSYLVTGYIVFRGAKAHWPIKLTVIFLSIITTNDVLHSLRYIQTAIVIDLGFSAVLLAFMTIQLMNYKKGFFEYAEKRAELVWGEKFLNLARQVAHDIRSPLQSMVFAADELKASASNSPELKSSPINVLQLGLARIHSILGRLIAEFKGPQTGSETQVHQPKLTLVDNCIRDVLIEHKWNDEKVTNFSIVGLNELGPTWAVIDPVELQAAISNVIRNATESFEKSKLPKNERAVAVSVSNKDGQLTLTIRDNGCGISTEHLGRVFERGFTSGKKSGTGLGLAQVKEAIERVEGKVEIESVAGKGTSVMLQIPIESKPRSVTETIEFRKDSVLYLIDDDPSVQQLWKNKIAESDVDSTKAIIRSSLRQIDGTAISASATVVLDHYYRGDSLSGIEWLKSQSRLSQRRFYLCTTAYDDPEIQAEASKLGVSIIPKPLIDRVRFKGIAPEIGVHA